MRSPWLLQPLFTGEVLQPFSHLCGPSLDLFQQLCIRPVLGAPGLDTVLQLRPHKGRIEGANPLPLPADHPAVDAAQNTVGFLGCKSTLLAHAQLFIIRIPIYMVAFSKYFSQSVLMSGIASTQVQHLALCFVKPHKVLMGRLLSLSRFPWILPSGSALSLVYSIGSVGVS